MTTCRFGSIDALSRRASQLAPGRGHPADRLAVITRLAAESGADPFLIMGILVEGAVRALAQHVPPERQTDAAHALRDMLADCLRRHRL